MNIQNINQAVELLASGTIHGFEIGLMTNTGWEIYTKVSSANLSNTTVKVDILSNSDLEDTYFCSVDDKQLKQTMYQMVVAATTDTINQDISFLFTNVPAEQRQVQILPIMQEEFV